MDGKALAGRIRADVAGQIAELGHVGLATVLVGDDPASDVYIRLKHGAAKEAGIDARDVRLDAATSEADVLALVDELNADDEVDGILVQLPLPSHIDETRVTYAVAPHKDVDGFHPVNAGNLYLGTPLHIPATPAGCMALLEEYGVDPKGKNAVVIGRSEIVGRPAAMLLLQAHATVTICHSRTVDLGGEVKRADIVVAAVGVPGIVSPDMVKQGATVIDVGLTRTEEGIRGDVDPAVADAAGHRADDDRAPARERRQGRSLSPRAPCIPDALTIRCPPFVYLASARADAVLRRTFVVCRDGHRQVVLEREGIRVHRTRGRR